MIPGWLVALGLTLIVEIPVVAAFYPGRRVRMSAVAFGANCATNLTLNLVLARLLPYPDWLLVGEVGALAFEAACYALLSSPFDVPRALLASALANGLSYGAGLLLFRLPG